jgi:hypothetical protein
MLAEKIDLARFMTWFIEEYPASAREAGGHTGAKGPWAILQSASAESARV